MAYEEESDRWIECGKSAQEIAYPEEIKQQEMERRLKNKDEQNKGQ